MWLKHDKPGKAPPLPSHVDAVDLQTQLADRKAQGPLTPTMAYLDQFAPVPPLDRWGMPLPLSATDQDKLDRMAAVLFHPLLRGRQLLLSGMLDTDECSALRQGAPDAYELIRSGAEREMITAGPPLPQWADGVLGVLFGRDAAIVYGDAKDQPKPPQQGSNYQGKPPNPTPADKAGDPQLKGQS